MTYDPEEGEELADAGFAIARALRLLGNADAGTPLGALEALGVAIRESATEIALGLSEIAEALRAAGK